jgi:tRNA pseudouridine13 synthase
LRAKPKGRIKRTPEEFVVEEVPAYEPCGSGEHLFVRFRKRGLTTPDAAGAIARAVGVRVRDVGIAGMKDKVAVTTQTISLPIAPKSGDELERRVRSLAIDGIAILDARRHTSKLRTGHLAANRFSIMVSGIEPERFEEVAASLQELSRSGLPNSFGAQRFGRDGENADKARHWLSGRGAPPRDPRLKRLLFSALQADLFNRLLAVRVADGTWSTPLDGDLVKRSRGHALFLWRGKEEQQLVPAEGELGEGPRGTPLPTGPIFGLKMRQPEGVPLEIEQRVLHEGLGEGVVLENTRSLGEGTRRPLCLWLDDFAIERIGTTAPPVTSAEGETTYGVRDRLEEGGMRVHFVLPKGGYATSVLAKVLSLDEGAARERELPAIESE